MRIYEVREILRKEGQDAMKHLYLTLLFVSVELFPFAWAQAQSERFSQLEFDKAGPPLVDPQELLDSGMVLSPGQKLPDASVSGIRSPLPAVSAPTVTKTASAANGSPAAGRRNARARLNSRSLDVDAIESPFIAPRLKGPFVDEGRENKITTVNGWLQEGPGGCARVERPETVCRKAAALRELLYRFSGSDGFFAQQCSQTCDSGLKSVPTGLYIRGDSAGSFNIVFENHQCRYQTERAADGRWLALQATKVTCSCLPDSCLPQNP